MSTMAEPTWWVRLRHLALLIAVIAAAAELAAGVPPWLAFTSAGVAGAAGATAVLIRRGRRLARRRAEEIQSQAARRESAIRILWAASGDFLAAGWGRTELERLRLLALNLPPGRDLGPRLAERLRGAVSAVLCGALDRLQDVVTTAGEVGLQPATVVRLEAALRILAAELETATCRPGAPPGFRAPVVAAAAAQAIEACNALRRALQPHVTADLPAILHWIAESHHPELVAAGGLRVDTSRLAPRTFVAVRPLDLAQALGELLEHVVGRSALTGPVELGCRSVGSDVLLEVTWRAGDVSEPAVFAESLRVLGSYGARVTIVERPHGQVRLCSALPAIRPAAAA